MPLPYDTMGCRRGETEQKSGDFRDSVGYTHAHK